MNWKTIFCLLSVVLSGFAFAQTSAAQSGSRKLSSPSRAPSRSRPSVSRSGVPRSSFQRRSISSNRTATNQASNQPTTISGPISTDIAAEPLLAIFDGNGNGSISKQEVNDVLLVLTQLDGNGDGLISKDEMSRTTIAAAVPAQLHRPQSRPTPAASKTKAELPAGDPLSRRFGGN